MEKIPPGVGPKHSQVIVLVGATGDLSRRKLLPGLFHLSSAGFIPGCRIIGVSLDQVDPHGFCEIARGALNQFSSRKVKEADWAAFAETLDYVPMASGAHALKAAVEKAEQKLGTENRRVHYLSVPPSAALSAVRLLRESDLVDRSRIIMEKPFGTAHVLTKEIQMHLVLDGLHLGDVLVALGKGGYTIDSKTGLLRQSGNAA